MASPAALWDIVSKAKDPKTGLRAKRKKSSKKGADILDGKDVIQWMLREITSDDRPEALRLLQLLLDKGLFVQADLADNPDLPAYLRNPLFDEEKQYCFEEEVAVQLELDALLVDSELKSLQAIAAQMQDPAKGIELKDRKYRLRRIRHTCLGSEALAWLSSTCNLDASNALIVAQHLQNHALIHNVASKSEPFNAKGLYRFVETDSKAGGDDDSLGDSSPSLSEADEPPSGNSPVRASQDRSPSPAAPAADAPSDDSQPRWQAIKVNRKEAPGSPGAPPLGMRRGSPGPPRGGPGRPASGNIVRPIPPSVAPPHHDPTAPDNPPVVVTTPSEVASSPEPASPLGASPDSPMAGAGRARGRGRPAPRARGRGRGGLIPAPSEGDMVAASPGTAPIPSPRSASVPSRMQGATNSLFDDMDELSQMGAEAEGSDSSAHATSPPPLPPKDDTPSSSSPVVPIMAPAVLAARQMDPKPRSSTTGIPSPVPGPRKGSSGSFDASVSPAASPSPSASSLTDVNRAVPPLPRKDDAPPPLPPKDDVPPPLPPKDDNRSTSAASPVAPVPQPRLADLRAAERERRRKQVLEFQRAFVETLVKGYETLIAPMFKAEDIASTELDQIVGNLEELKKCHEAILPQLDSCPTAGQMLIRISSTIDPYIPYVANRARSAPVLLSVRDRHGFTQVMRNSTLSFGLDDLLQAPISHLRELESMHQELLDQTASTTDIDLANEHSDLKIAHSFLSRVTDMLRQRDCLPNYLRPIWDIRHSIVGQPPFELSESLELVKEGKLKVLQARGLSQTPAHVHLFLFNELLVCVSYLTSYSFLNIMTLPIHTVVVFDISEDEAPTAFEVTSSKQDRAIRVQCDDAAAKKAWLKVLPVHYPERQKMKVKLQL